MAKIIEHLVENYSDQFLGIVPPQLKFFKIELHQTTKIKRKIKTQEELEKSNDFNIKINCEEINRSYYKEIGENLKEIFEMSWAPFDYDRKVVSYYTSKYTGDDESKKQKLINIFNFLQEYDKEYLNKHQQAFRDFTRDKVESKTYKDEDIVVKYDETNDVMIVMARTRLDYDKFKLLASAKKVSGKMSELGIPETFFDDVLEVKNKEKKLCFIIPPYDYNNLKQLIETTKENKKEFMNNQNDVILKDRHHFIQYNEKNLFDLRIEFNEELKCFEFYCKGFNPPKDKEGFAQPRKLLARWALNFILSQHEDEITEIEELEKKYDYNDSIEIDRQDSYKIQLDIQKAMHVEKKCLLVPAANWKKLNQIYENFLEQMILFNRPEAVMKIMNCNVLGRSGNQGVHLDTYPSIYFDEQGKSYFIHSYRSISGKREMDEHGKYHIIKNDVLHMKGFEISFEEVNYFFNQHPLATQIYNNSEFMNSEIWMKGDTHILLNSEERKKAFETIYEHAKLAAMPNDMQPTKKHKL